MSAASFSFISGTSLTGDAFIWSMPCSNSFLKIFYQIASLRKKCLFGIDSNNIYGVFTFKKENKIKKMKPDLRYEPLYSYTEVSRYARIPTTTLRLWMKKNGVIVPPINDSLAPLSFINLIESHVLVALRRTHQVPMQRIRRAVEWLQGHYNTSHPLAELDLETDGRDLFIRELGLPINASKGGQSAFAEILSLYLQRIDRDKKNIPIRFYPFPYDTSPKLIVMDPLITYGRPVIKGTRISTVIVFERYSAGESLSDIAADYDLKIPFVEEALRCEIERRAA